MIRVASNTGNRTSTPDGTRPQRLRVLFVTRKFLPSIGGMEVYSTQLHKALAAEVELDLFKPDPPIHGRPTLLRLTRFILAATWHLAKYSRKYDVVLLGDYVIAVLGFVVKIASWGNTGTAVSLHGNDIFFMRRRSLRARAYALLSRSIVSTRCVDVALANSSTVAAEAQARGIDPVHVVPLATEIPQLAGGTEVKRGQLLFVGRLVRCKGLSWFMREVWPLLPDSTSLVVVGPVWDEEELAAITQVPRVRYLGILAPAEIPTLRAESMACIMPNIPPRDDEQPEGFGLSALEGPAVGTPILASRNGGLIDAVVDGVTGFLLPPLDASAWVSSICDVFAWSGSERSSFGARARDCIAERYNWELVAQRTASVLRDLGYGPGNRIDE